MLVVLIGAGVASWLNSSRQSSSQRMTGDPRAEAATDSTSLQLHDSSMADNSRNSGSTTEVDHAPSDLLDDSNAWIPTSAEATRDNIVEAFTEPYRDIAAAAAEMGTLATISVKEGQPVAAGDVLATMDDRVLQAALDVARRSMTAVGAVHSAQADLESKTDSVDKLRGLRERGHASQQEVERIESDREVSEARLLSVREDLEVKQLEFRRIEAQIEQRIIRATIAGIVTELQREPGEFVSPSEPVIARIVQLDPLLVVFSVPLGHRTDFAVDQVVPVEIGDGMAVVNGVVEFVAPTPDSSNSSVRVKVRIPNSDRLIPSGERAALRLQPTSSVPDVPATEASATPIARRDP